MGETLQRCLRSLKALQSVSREELIIILSVSVGSIILVTIIITILCVYCCRRANRSREKKNANDINGQGFSTEITSKSDFYDNLPFRGYKSPPSKIINRESCDYADCDYADYADGPIKYKQMSKIQAEEIKKNIIEEEKELRYSYHCK